MAGLAGAFVADSVLKNILLGVSGQNPWTLFTATLILLLISALASFLPARKAIRIDPSAALRQS
jgi:putative ABC transport system permease protein